MTPSLSPRVLSACHSSFAAPPLSTFSTRLSLMLPSSHMEFKATACSCPLDIFHPHICLKRGNWFSILLLASFPFGSLAFFPSAAIVSVSYTWLSLIFSFVTSTLAATLNVSTRWKTRSCGNSPQCSEYLESIYQPTRAVLANFPFPLREEGRFYPYYWCVKRAYKARVLQLWIQKGEQIGSPLC